MMAERQTLQIAFSSDLHVDQGVSVEELESLVREIQSISPDVFILGGDIAGGVSGLTAEIFQLFRTCAPVCLTVPGNHDLWVFADSECRDSWEAYERYQDYARAAGFIPLDSDGPVCVDGVGFAGCMGWYDYSFRDVRLDGLVSYDQYVAKSVPEFDIGWNDGNYISWSDTDEKVTVEQLRRITSQLELLEADPAVREIVVVNHHLPYELLLRRPEIDTHRGCRWNIGNAWMGSRRFGKMYDQFEKISTVICGHTHFAKELWLGDRHILMNGRPGRPMYTSLQLLYK